MAISRHSGESAHADLGSATLDFCFPLVTALTVITTDAIEFAGEEAIWDKYSMLLTVTHKFKYSSDGAGGS